MTDVIVRAVDHGGAALIGARVIAELVNGTTRERVSGRLVSNNEVVADKVTGKIKSTTSDQCTLTLTPNEDITPANTYYLFRIRRPSDNVDVDVLAEVPDSPTPVYLTDIEVETPDTLGLVSRIDMTGVEDGQTFGYDAATATYIPQDVANPISVAAKLDRDGGTVENLTLGTDVDADGNKITGAADGEATTDLPPLKQVVARDPHGHQHSSIARGLLAGIMRAERRQGPARFVQVADSIWEIGFGLSGVWSEMQKQLAGGQPWRYMAVNGLWNAFVGWDNQGTTAEIGLDGRGLILDSTGDHTRTPAVGLYARTVRVYYEARSGGGTATVRTRPPAGSWTTHTTIDFSEDQDGNPVASDTPGQMWESSELDATLEVGVEWVSGNCPVEAIELTGDEDGGVSVRGNGFSGQSMVEALASGNALAAIETMVDRGEAPDVVILGCESGDGDTSSAMVAAVESFTSSLATMSPTTDVVYYIPHKHAQNYATWDTDFYPALFAMAVRNGFLVVDGTELLGDTTDTPGGNPHGFGASGADDTHLSAAGTAALEAGVLRVLRAGSVRSPAGTAVSIDPTDLTLTATTAQELAEEVDASLDTKADLAGANFTGAVNITVGGTTRVRVDADGVEVYKETADTEPILRLQSFFGVAAIAAGPGGSTAPTWGLVYTASGVMQLESGDYIRAQSDPSNGNDLARKSWIDTQLDTKLTTSGLLAAILGVDGAGSGIDADLLDGVQLAALAQLAGATFTGATNVDVSGVRTRGDANGLSVWSSTAHANPIIRLQSFFGVPIFAMGAGDASAPDWTLTRTGAGIARLDASDYIRAQSDPAHDEDLTRRSWVRQGQLAVSRDSTASPTISATVGVHVYTGTSGTATLPAVSGNTNARITIKHGGASGTLTVQRAGSDNLWTDQAVTSISLPFGWAAEVICDGTYWQVIRLTDTAP